MKGYIWSGCLLPLWPYNYYCHLFLLCFSHPNNCFLKVPSTFPVLGPLNIIYCVHSWLCFFLNICMAVCLTSFRSLLKCYFIRKDFSGLCKITSLPYHIMVYPPLPILLFLIEYIATLYNFICICMNVFMCIHIICSIYIMYVCMYLMVLPYLKKQKSFGS